MLTKTTDIRVPLEGCKLIVSYHMFTELGKNKCIMTKELNMLP